MENSANRLSCQQLRDYDLVSYLDQLGISPQKIAGNNFWYLSPFRQERTPSFKVNRKLNCWYDFGEGAGGNLIDFAIRYQQCTIGELLAGISSARPLPVHAPAGLPEAPDTRIEIVKDCALAAPPLLRYLRKRHIPAELATQYCRELHYQVGEKSFYGIGFKNDLGGYEIRNPYFKGSSAPKWVSTFDNGAGDLYVFEGFFDFLSFLVICPETPGNFLVLNSLSFFEQARPFMEAHQAIHLYLDRDRPGRKITRYAVSLSERYTDQSILYHNRKDLNDFLCFFGTGASGTSG